MRLPSLIAGVVTAGAMVVLPQAAASSAAGPTPEAVTDLACNFDYINFNACLNFNEPLLNSLDAHVGLNVNMPQRYAQDIVAFGGPNAQAQLYWTNGTQSRHVADLTVLPNSPVSFAGGLGASLVARGLSRADLNINPTAGATESFYAVVSYFDFHGQGSWKSFRTGTVTGEFAPRDNGGGGGCATACN